MFMTIEPNINVDEELAALLADFDAIAAIMPTGCREPAMLWRIAGSSRRISA